MPYAFNHRIDYTPLTEPVTAICDNTKGTAYAATTNHVYSLPFVASAAASQEGGEEYSNHDLPIAPIEVLKSSLPLDGVTKLGHTGTYLLAYVKASNQIHFLNDANGVAIFSFTVPSNGTINSNIVVANGKIWYTISDVDLQGRNNIYVLDATTGAVSTAVAIPATPMISRDRHIVDGGNGFLYIGNWNNATVSKHNSTTGAYVNTISIGNREVNRLAADGSGHICVQSRTGLISSIDGPTDAVTHPWTSMYKPLTGMVANTDYIWFATEDFIIGRLNKSDLSIVYTGATDNDYLLDEFGTPMPTNGNIRMMRTSTAAYVTGGVTKYTKPYVFVVISDTDANTAKISAFRDYLPLCTPTIMTVSAVGMLSTGAFDYTGD